MTFKPAHLLVVLLATALPVMAQNLAVVNGKAIPANRVDAMVKQLAEQGQKLQSLLAVEVVDEDVGGAKDLQDLERGLAWEIKAQAGQDQPRRPLLSRFHFPSFPT